MSTQITNGVLSLTTLLRITAVMGVGVGVVNAAVAVAFYWERLNLGEAIGLFIGGALFNALALMFATLIGYWPYRALARQGCLGLHRLGLYPSART